MTAVIGHGWVTLLYKELLRFWKVSFQTIAAPILTRAAVPADLLARARGSRVSVYDGRVTYTAFLVPGLVMMSVLQNSFANSSSSLIQSKITGNLIFVLLPPLSRARSFRRVRAGRDGARHRGRGSACSPSRCSLRRRCCDAAPAVGACLRAAGQRHSRDPSACWPGSRPDKFDQLAAFQNFIIVPLTFLSGVFYSIHSLPPFWQALSHFNPFFYMIDGFRYGFFGRVRHFPGDRASRSSPPPRWRSAR